MKKIVFIFFVSLFNLNNCTASNVSKLSSGTASCFKEGEIAHEGVSCELSAFQYYKGKLLTASDKEEGRVLVYDPKVLEAGGQKIPLSQDIILPEPYKVAKVESMTTFHDWVIVVGSYIRTDLPQYCRIVAFKYDPLKNEATQHHLVADAEIRKNIANFFDNAPYFKVEGAAIKPDAENTTEGTLYLGVREAGEGYKEGEFKYYTRILSVRIKQEGDHLKLDPATWGLVYDMTDKNPEQGISDLAYDQKTNYLYMTTSFEKNGKLDAALWRISFADFFDKKDFTKLDGVSFDGLKIEGITLSEDGKIFLVADQDRVPTGIEGKPRELYEAPYMVLKAK